MARARNIKPGFFKNEVLAEMPASTRLLFIGLWCLADREGRFENRPKRIKIELFPMDEIDIAESLNELCAGGFLVLYEAHGKSLGQIVNFTKHQVPHHKEVASELPAPEGFAQITKHAYDVPIGARQAVFSRDGNCCLKCSSREDLAIDHIVPLASGGDNAITNLQTLCKRCNSSKGNSTKDYRKVNIESTLAHERVNHGANCRTDSLIPDSLNLIPDSLIPEEENIKLSLDSLRPNDEGQEDERHTPQLFENLPESRRTPAKPSIPDCPHLEILNLWAEVLPTLPQHLPQQWRGSRSDHLRARWKEKASEKGWATKEEGLSYFRTVFELISESSFLCGRAHSGDPSRRPFQATLEWVVLPGNWAKVLEQRYNDRMPA